MIKKVLKYWAVKEVEPGCAGEYRYGKYHNFETKEEAKKWQQEQIELHKNESYAPMFREPEEKEFIFEE